MPTATWVTRYRSAVVGYHSFISPSGVGYDIACGNLAATTNLRAAEIDDWTRLANQTQRRISFGIGRSNNDPFSVFRTDAPGCRR